MLIGEGKGGREEGCEVEGGGVEWRKGEREERRGGILYIRWFYFCCGIIYNPSLSVCSEYLCVDTLYYVQ